jgi:hypothetical protein
MWELRLTVAAFCEIMVSSLIRTYMRKDADLIPMNPAEILRISPERAFNIAAANVRNPDTISSLIASSIRKMETIRTEIEMLEATLAVYDLTPKNVKVSKRIVLVPKYARGVTK